MALLVRLAAGNSADLPRSYLSAVLPLTAKLIYYKHGTGTPVATNEVLFKTAHVPETELLNLLSCKEN